VVKALQFHRITPKFQFCGTWNRPEQFESFLKFLRSCGIAAVLPGEEKEGVVITFDDGEKSIYEYAFPILRKYNMKAVVFLIVGYVGKTNIWDLSLNGERTAHLSWNEIIEMKNYGIEFGSHTMTHRNLTRLSLSDLEYELFESKKILDEKIGGCDCVSYPFNRLNEQVIRVAGEAGYKFGFGGDGGNALALKKEAIYITDTVGTLRIKIFERPILWYGYERLKQKVINYFTIATMLSQKKVYAKNRS